MNLPLDRDTFEANHPRPTFVHWDAEKDQYCGEPGFVSEATLYQHLWDGWRTALSTYQFLLTPTIEDDSQTWAGMPGHVAYSLIERHADNWPDIAKMMNEWRLANPNPTNQPIVHQETQEP